jgi:hypothetical protein
MLRGQVVVGPVLLVFGAVRAGIPFAAFDGANFQFPEASAVRFCLRRHQIAYVANNVRQRFDPPDMSLDEGPSPVMAATAEQAGRGL